MSVTLVRTLILYLSVVAALRIMGKRQIGEMQPKELVVAFLISELAALPMTDLNRPLMGAIIAIFALVAIEVALSAVSIKSVVFRRVLNGRPAIVINDGVIDQRMLKKLRLSAEELMQNLREKDIFNIEQVQYAIVEITGKISVIQKPEFRMLTPQDMSLPTQDNGIGVSVVSDGKIRKQGFAACGIDEAKITEILTTRRMALKDVFLMTADKTGNYVIIRKE